MNPPRKGYTFLGAAIILISWDWRFVPVMIAAALIGSGVMVAFREPMKRRHKRMQAAEDALHASTQETLENIRLVKAGTGEERAIGHLDADRDHLLSEQVRNGKLSTSTPCAIRRSLSSRTAGRPSRFVIIPCTLRMGA